MNLEPGAAKGLIVRTGELHDVASIARIEKEVFPDPWSRAAFISTMTEVHSRVAVAELGNEILGYSVATFVADEGELANIAVAPGRQRMGVGRTLLEDVVAEAQRRGVVSIFLEVRRSNAAARALYEHAGFTECGCRHGYYSHPREDAIVMVRRGGSGGGSDA
jgi:ribosomal-protein-alanine acetyltransferase